MTYKVVVDRQVRDDLLGIHEHIAHDDPAAAGRFVDLVAATIRSLADMPERAPLRPDVRDGYRAMVMGNYLLFYRIDGDAVHVARVIHAARDIRRVFGDASDDT